MRRMPPAAHHLPRTLAGDEVEVAGSDASLLAELGVQVGQRAQRLGGDLPLLHHHRQLAAATRNDLAGNEEVVTEIDEFLPQFERLLADDGERDHGLDARSVAGLQRGEAQLARVAQVHDAAGEADDLARGGIRLELAEAGTRLGDGRSDRQRHRIGARA